MTGEETTGRPGGGRSAAGGAELAVGTELGRYVVLSELGRGGLGVVFRAYDPELEREVAIKMVSGVSGEDASEQRSTVLAEARALAKLRHPNVVVVHDVGDHEGRIWMAMELLEGASLRGCVGDESTMGARKRLLSQAGAALMAAHAAGIVHCDFKPENVVVTDRAHVVDFGLAHAMGTGSSATKGVAPAGTISYLAPELYEGTAPNPASDLYAFCVTAWEVLFGSRPWPNSTEDALLDAKREVPRLPSRRGVSRKLANLLRSGLAPDPSKRLHSLKPLVIALQPRGPTMGMAAAAAVVGAGFIAWASAGNTDCAAPTDQPPFDEPSMTRLQAAFDDTPSGRAAWEPLHRNIEAFARDYARQYRQSCEATRERGVKSSAELDARISCLDRRREQLQVLLLRQDAEHDEALRAAPRAVARIAQQLACDRPTAPSPPVEAAFLVALDEIEVLEFLSSFDEASERSQKLEDDAARLGARSAELWARYRRGRLMHLRDDAKQAAELLAQVHWDAEAAELPDLAATAGLYVLYLHAGVFHDAEEAQRWAPHVASSIRQAGDDVLHRATLVEQVGVSMLYESRAEEALEQFKNSLALRESVDSDADLAIVSSLGNMGIALEELNRFEEAILQQQRALEISVRRVGALNPHTARVVDNLGTATLRSGDFPGALELFEQALEARLELFGPAHRSTALSHLHIGLAYMMSDRPNAAIAPLQRAREVLEQLEDPGSLLGNAFQGLAHAHAIRGEWELATEHARAALARLPDTMPASHPERVGLREIIEQADQERL